MMNLEAVRCKYCNGNTVVKYGTFEGMQRYFCKDCHRKFADNDALPKMKTPVWVIASALNCNYEGMSLSGIQDHLSQQYGAYYSSSSIYNWIIRFSREAVVQARTFKPATGETLLTYETSLRVGTRHIWFRDFMDADSGYLIASRLSLSRSAGNVSQLVEPEARKNGNILPKIILIKTPTGIRTTSAPHNILAGDTAEKPVITTDVADIHSHFTSLLKIRKNIMHGFKNIQTARLVNSAWQVHYNFIKSLDASGNLPPAQKLGKVPFKSWLDIVSQAALTVNQGGYKPVITPRAYIRL